MGRKKIAPVLTALMQDLTEQAARPQRKSYPMPGDSRVARYASAELRALLAVARAANNHWCDFCDGYHSDVSVDVPAWKAAGGRVCPEAHALARLERAGKEEG